MRSRQNSARVLRAVTFSLLAGASAVPLLLSETAWAGQRQFLVILATSPKEFNGTPPGGLPNPQQIRNQYFDTINPGINSFAEYWKEISYGDVTISGQVTDWVQLPWSIQPKQPMNYVDLDGDGKYKYGKGEKFNNQKAMVIVDIDGDGLDGVDNGPRRVEDNPPYARGARLTTSAGQPVWTAGERFLDMDGDGRWDGYDESRNAMDWVDANGQPNADGRPDLRGPWYDLNNNGIPENEDDCVYLEDSDNDGNPNCCPNGPGTPGCGGIGSNGTGTNACPPRRWPGPDDTEITDCNGNLIPDACDLSCTSQDCRDTGYAGGGCGLSKDQLPYAAQGTQCLPGDGDGTPDECQWSNPTTPCVASAPICTPDNQDVCCTVRTVCQALPAAQLRFPVTVVRCEFDDGNGDGELDVVEPFENFLARVKLKADEREDKPDYCVDKLPDAAIRDNFPGQGVNTVIARGTARLIYGAHDPSGKLSRCFCDHPFNTKLCGTDGAPAGMCKAGEHAQYDPPDFWVEPVPPNAPRTMKMLVDRDARVEQDLTTPEPLWYKQAWRDRYNGAEPPPWNPKTPKVTLITSDTVIGRREFIADRGGLKGDGTGWPECGAAAFPVEFKTAPCGDFEADCAAGAPILPEEANGVGRALILFDAGVEFDDLPSSKYHRAGDQQLGEVTSPFNRDIWGQDRGTNDPSNAGAPDKILPAAGPYATQLHGQLGRDAGNQLLIELLTWRTEPPYNNGAAWEAEHGTYHAYAGPSGLNLGFRDYNLDGLIDLGEVVDAGTENYLVDPERNGPRGTNSVYPWNRRRLMEDLIEVLDDVIDFDNWVDRVAMDAVTCGSGAIPAPVPAPFKAQGPVNVTGINSGIVLLPAGAHLPGDFSLATSFTIPDMYPIHNEDGLNDPAYTYAQFPKTGTRQLNWNLLFHDLVISLGAGEPQSEYAAHEWLHTWEHFPDLYDYDRYEPQAIENCPIGLWDIMADGGLVHPTPILKESGCTNWVEPVDLTCVLTPGVHRAITLPMAEFVRDRSYFFIENEDRPGERFYFWSAGGGFDQSMPGDGVLILHTDVGSNPAALPLQQRSGDRPAYMIVQADGDNDLQTCVNRGDDGDPWPGSSNNTHFACNTAPASEWYPGDACTGLEVLDIRPDGRGSALVTFNWTPTNIPSLKFVDPPGGVTVGNPPSVIYTIQTEATDVYGGTWIRFFYTTQDSNTPNPANATLIRTVRKGLPPTRDVSVDWNIVGVPDGRYFLFADLIPDQGANGRERKLTTVRAGRNNVGTASLVAGDVVVDTSTIANGAVTHTGTARLETWSIRCVDATAGKWFVGSSLTQPLPAEAPTLALCNANPTRCATTGTQYSSVGGEVKFTIKEGTGSSPKGEVDDTFTFTTTGITAPSVAVTIRNGQIREDPTAVIDASPLNGPPPLEVKFDARRSVDPNGQPLTFRWDFGDRATGTGAQVSHTYPDGGSFTVTLRATNPANGRYGEATVDIEVTNNSPTAVIKATPTSGQAPLEVHFSATQSRDTETAADQLIYKWNFGDGLGANDEGLPGVSREPEHTYSRVNTGADTTNCTAACPCTPTGRACTAGCPCTFTAVLTVTDGPLDRGGKSDTDSVVIRVGNTDPVAKITTTPAVLQGLSPLTVIFNAKDSTDPENDPLEVEWIWGDGSPNETYPAKTGKPPATDGSVPHTFTLPPDATFKTYTVKAVVYDLKADGRTRKGGEATWSRDVTVLSVEPPSTTNGPPIAKFCFQTQTVCVATPLEALVGEEVNFDASSSFDPDPGDELRYHWVFGDGNQTQFTTNLRTTTHTYTSPGSYLVRLTVRDKANASADFTQTVRVLLTGENRSPVAMIATGPRTGAAPLTLTFDGSISFDPDGDAITFTWEFRQDGALIDPIQTGSVVTRSFATPGEYTVELVVRDDDEAASRTEPQSILVTQPAAPPAVEPPPPRPQPQEPPDSASQRPRPAMCGAGMLMSVLASLLGFSLTVVKRRRLKV